MCGFQSPFPYSQVLISWLSWSGATKHEGDVSQGADFPPSVIQNVCTPAMWLTTLVFKIKKLLQTFQAIVKGYKAV